MTQFDFLIVGGGTAGAVLASRLSEDRACRVLLVEAGADTPPEATPSDINDTFPSSTLNPDYFWTGLEATLTRGGSSRPYPQARIMGGGSSIMGMFTLRGMPDDYDSWGRRGAGTFSWKEVVPFFEKVEGYPSSAGRNSGTYPVRRTPREEWPAFVHAMERAAGSRGFPFVPDMNAAPGDGFFSMPASRDETVRSTSAGAYLTREVRSRCNLTIMPSTRVTRLATEGRRVIGAHVDRNGMSTTISAGNVVLSAGAIHSPALMMRSGIGDGGALSALGIQVAAELPGVGRNLQNHCYMFFALTLPRGKRLPHALRRFAVAGLRASSGLADCPAGDLMLFMLGRVSGKSFGTDVAMVAPALYSPFSKGRVTLAAADASRHPRVEFCMLDDPRDAPRIVMAARLAESLLRDSLVAASYSEAMLLPAGMAMNQFNRGGLMGACISTGAQLVLNAPGLLRRAAMRLAFKGGKFLSASHSQSLSESDLLSAISPMGHPVGTCAMGEVDDPYAVVDSNYRVHGVDNLFVADASVMPTIPSGNTNLPTLMLGEHAAHKIQRLKL
ncbi:GMC family oxidoreductase [Variovorax sp. EL159]|uniref:GMC family oxidoreductase n=1 Tax=Variovorax sp. EL159 TaxID=1566270 RepID=UPI0008882F62|nr:GMC family oxidoreductase N-terminal domain-containing protein [Variovorax sp. EL159]SCX72532.1 5-(hydroxymethyl)furfural/furfural oxidase [Variovorax sp. EL159]